MIPLSGSRGLGLLVGWDIRLTRWMNRSLSIGGVQPLFAFVSWLGNGKLWYALMLLLLICTANGTSTAFHLAAVGLVNLVLYKIAKWLSRRPRPCNAYEEIMRGAVPLDEFSLPSGHTMHAVAFTLIASAYLPFLTVPLAVFTVLVAMSRVVLGLHYPTDVILGAAIGFLVAKSSFLLLAV
jgi:undecaprenyl-diphosphatase